MLHYDNYIIISGKYDKRNTENEKLNQEYIKENGLAILPGAEILNHRFSKKSDGDKKYGFNLKAKNGFLEYITVGSYRKGEEVNASYKEGSSNAAMISIYGAAAFGTMDNSVALHISVSQIDTFHNMNSTYPWRAKMCQYLMCLPHLDPMDKTYYVIGFDRKNEINRNLTNYMRVSVMSEHMTTHSLKQIFSNLENHNYISLYNEIGAIEQVLKFIGDIKRISSSRSENEKLYNGTKQMLEQGDFSAYNRTQLSNRLTALTAAIDEKMILDLNAILLSARLETLLYLTIEYEVSQLII